MINVVLISAAGIGLSVASSMPTGAPFVISEPASLALLAVGLFALSKLTRRRPVPYPDRSLQQSRLRSGEAVYTKS